MQTKESTSRVDTLTASAARTLVRVLDSAAVDTGRVRDMRLERYWPDKRGGATLEWTFDEGHGKRVHLFGKTEPGRKDNTGVKQTHTRLTDGLLEGLCVINSEGMLLHSADMDARLPQLAAARQTEAVNNQLDACIGSNTSGGRVTSAQVITYRPGRRAVLMYTVNGRDPVTDQKLIGKVFRDDRGASLLETHRLADDAIRKQTHGRVRVAQPLGYLPDWRMLVMSHVGHNPTAGDDSSRTRETLIRVLTQLHTINLPGLSSFSIKDELTVVDRWLGLYRELTGFLPDRVESTRAYLDRLASRITWSTPVTCHRDYYKDQVIGDADGATLLDLDTLALSHRGIDLGNLACHLLLDSEARGRAACAALLVLELKGAYERLGGVVGMDELVFFTISSLLRVGAVHALRAQTGQPGLGLWRQAWDLAQADDPKTIASTTTHSNHPAHGLSKIKQEAKT